LAPSSGKVSAEKNPQKLQFFGIRATWTPRTIGVPNSYGNVVPRFSAIGKNDFQKQRNIAKNMRFRW